MNESLETKGNSYKSENIYLAIIFMLVAIFMNQSSIIFGVNFSIADIILFIGLLFLIVNQKLSLPIVPAIFFIVLSIIVLLTSTFYVPFKFDYQPNSISIISNYIKLLILFIYFFIGYNTKSNSLIIFTVKWYSFTALIIGTLGIIFTVFNINFLSETLFLDASRYKGLMNDPNFFAIIQVSALVYFTRIKAKSFFISKVITPTIVVSILVSGSKTGFITLGIYIVFRFVSYIIGTKKSYYVQYKNIIGFSIIVLVVYIFKSYFTTMLEYLTNLIPSFQRVEVVLTNFNESISGSGSGREGAWSIAIRIIKLSPIIGIGIGTYIGISREIFNTNVIAHNTYLQLATEWGILLSILYFLFITYLMWKASVVKNNYSEISLILRDIIIIFLIGSLAISLNNARMIWFFMGMLFFTTSSRVAINNKI